MKKAVLAIGLLASLCAASRAVAMDRHYSIRAESVAAAMSGMGMNIPADQVTLLADVVASSNTPKLRVKSMEKSGDNRLMVRLECETSDECLPFYARIHSSGEDERKISSTIGSPETGSVGRPKSIQIHTGSTATLLLDGQHIHITLPVVSLENGVVGQRIRVSTDDRQRTYFAEVVNDHVLKGSL